MLDVPKVMPVMSFMYAFYVQVQTKIREIVGISPLSWVNQMQTGYQVLDPYPLCNVPKFLSDIHFLFFPSLLSADAAKNSEGNGSEKLVPFDKCRSFSPQYEDV